MKLMLGYSSYVARAAEGEAVNDMKLLVAVKCGAVFSELQNPMQVISHVTRDLFTTLIWQETDCSFTNARGVQDAPSTGDVSVNEASLARKPTGLGE